MTTSYLQIKANEVRSNRVNWQSLLQSRILTQDDYRIVSKLDGTTEQLIAQFNENPTQYVKTLLHLVVHVNKDPTVQFILTRISDVLQEDKSIVSLFYDYGRSVEQPTWTPFLPLLQRPDRFIANQSAQIVAKLATWTNKVQMEENDLTYYLTWLMEQLRTPKNDFIETVVYCLQSMLRVPGYRQQFVEKDGVRSIVTVLEGKVGFQLQYQLIFCLWVITFDPKLSDIVTKCNVVPILSDVLSETAKEKVIRIILATFRNLLEKPTEEEWRRENALAMIQGKVHKHLQLMESKKFEDTDITEDMQFLQETLEVSIQDVSSFDEYSTELKSGRLEWSLVHKSGKFWMENVTRLNEKNFELLKILVNLLSNNPDPVTQAVAVHDIGQYVRHYPRGKTIVEQLGGKLHVMNCLTHENTNVRYEALIALQKIMVHNWEYLGKQIEPPNSGNKEGASKKE